MRWFSAGARTALSGPPWCVALSLMSTGALARTADFPPEAAMLATALIWAGPGQILFFAAMAAKTAPAAIAFAVSLSSARLLPMCLSVLPMLRGEKTRRSTLLLAAHFIVVTVWAESLRRLPDMEQARRLPFFFGFALTCAGLTTLGAGFGYWLTAAARGRGLAGDRRRRRSGAADAGFRRRRLRPAGARDRRHSRGRGRDHRGRVVVELERRRTRRFPLTGG